MIAPLPPRSRWSLACVGLVMIAASCGNAPGAYTPMNGGPGSVINSGGIDAAADGPGDAPEASGDARADAPSTDGYVDVAMGAAGAGTAGAGGTDGGAAGGAGTSAAGGAGGTAPVDDPCTACEKARCRNPMGPGDTRSIYAQEAGSISLCFDGMGVPLTIEDISVCNGRSTGATAMAGPATGSPKSTLCQNLLKCVHTNNCADTDCICGTNVDGPTCESTTFTLMGACISQVEAASESVQIAGDTGVANNFFTPCLATGAAFTVVDFCDANCCPDECNNHTTTPDPTYCNAPGATGSAGASGAAGVVGAAGAVGAAGVVGTAGAGGSAAAGSSGAAGTAGAAGAGGTPGAAGASGAAGAGGSSAAGSSGAAGTAGAAGAAGAAGSAGATGAAGAAGATGAAGAAGAPPPSSLVTNSTFDTSTANWTPSASASVTRSSNDADGSAQSGSLSVAITAGDTTIAQQVGAIQCLAVTAGTSYKLAAEILIPGQNNSLGNIALWFYPSTDCSGAQSMVFASDSSAMNTWQHVTAATTVPANAHSVGVHLQVLKPAGQTSAAALFDDVVVTSP